MSRRSIIWKNRGKKCKKLEHMRNFNADQPKFEQKPLLCAFFRMDSHENEQMLHNMEILELNMQKPEHMPVYYSKYINVLKAPFTKHFFSSLKRDGFFKNRPIVTKGVEFPVFRTPIHTIGEIIEEILIKFSAAESRI